MTAEIIPPDQLPAGITEGVNVDGVHVYRYGRAGWGLANGYAAALWATVQAETPAQEGQPLRSGCIPAAGFSGLYTKAQADAYLSAVARLVNAARRATAPKRAKRRADREAAAARHVETARVMYAAHDAKHAGGL